MSELTDPVEAIEHLAEYKRVLESRDRVVRLAYGAGLSKQDIHNWSGIARTTIDRILAESVNA